MSIRSVVFCLALLISFTAPAFSADKKITEAGKGPWTGAIARDGEKLLLRKGKNPQEWKRSKVFRLKPAEDAPADVKKAMAVDNASLYEDLWTVDGSATEEDGLPVILVKSIKSEGKKPKK
jgi:hypothetical protein